LEEEHEARLGPLHAPPEYPPEAIMTSDQFTKQLSMMLRDLPRGTTADISDFAVAYWDGNRVTFCFLNDDSGEVDEEFELGDYEWSEWKAVFECWMREPKFSKRDTVLSWLDDAPPV
jgi:hypothetical protein